MCRTHDRLLALIIAVGPAACSGAIEPVAETTRILTEDGVRVVESVAPSWTPVEALELSSEPIVQIGVAEGADHDMLTGIHGLAWLPDGRIVIADASNELRVFAGDGTFITRLGRSGSGPCEFGMIGEPWTADDGSIAVPDYGGRRVSLLGADGSCLATLSMPLAGYTSEEVGGRFADGSLALAAWNPRDEPREDGGDVTWREATLVRAGWDGATQELATVPWLELSAVRGTTLYFASQAMVAAAGDRLIFSDGDRYSADIYDPTGQLLMRARRAELPFEVDEDTIERFQERSRANIRAFGRDPKALDRLARARFAPRTPGYRRLLVDAEGRVWGRRHLGLPDVLPFVYAGRPLEEQTFAPPAR